MSTVRVVAAISVAALSVTLAACGSSSSSSSTTAAAATNAAASTTSQSSSSSGIPKNLAVTFGSADDEVALFKTVSSGIVTDAKALGWTINEYDNALDGPTALRNAGLMVQDHPDVAIDWNTVVAVGRSVGAQFTRNNIKCLAVNQQIPGCAWFNLSNEEAGLEAASAILPIAKQRGWNGKNTTVVMVVAAANGVEVNNGPRYFYIETAKELPGFVQVTPAQITATTTTIGGTRAIQIDCKSTLDGAYAAAKNIVGDIPKSNNILLYGSDDDCDLGAYRALTQAGWGKGRVLTGGLAAEPEGLNELRTDPNWVFENSEFIQDWGPYVLAEAAAIHDGVTPPMLTPSPEVGLTKQTVNEYYNAQDNPITLPALVPDNEYLAKTGILQKFLKIKGLNAS
jgi:ribose transport system substrate-binding protein